MQVPLALDDTSTTGGRKAERVREAVLDVATRDRAVVEPAPAPAPVAEVTPEPPAAPAGPTKLTFAGNDLEIKDPQAAATLQRLAARYLDKAGGMVLRSTQLENAMYGLARKITKHSDADGSRGKALAAMAEAVLEGRDDTVWDNERAGVPGQRTALIEAAAPGTIAALDTLADDPDSGVAEDARYWKGAVVRELALAASYGASAEATLYPERAEPAARPDSPVNGQEHASGVDATGLVGNPWDGLVNLTARSWYANGDWVSRVYRNGKLWMTGSDEQVREQIQVSRSETAALATADALADRVLGHTAGPMPEVPKATAKRKLTQKGVKALFRPWQHTKEGFSRSVVMGAVAIDQVDPEKRESRGTFEVRTQLGSLEDTAAFGSASSWEHSGPLLSLKAAVAWANDKRAAAVAAHAGGSRIVVMSKEAVLGASLAGATRAVRSSLGAAQEVRVQTKRKDMYGGAEHATKRRVSFAIGDSGHQIGIEMVQFDSQSGYSQGQFYKVNSKWPESRAHTGGWEDEIGAGHRGGSPLSGNLQDAVATARSVANRMGETIAHGGEE